MYYVHITKHYCENQQLGRKIESLARTRNDGSTTDDMTTDAVWTDHWSYYLLILC